MFISFVVFWTVVGFESQCLLKLKTRRKEKKNKEWIASNKLMKDLSGMFQGCYGFDTCNLRWSLSKSPCIASC